MTSTRAPIDHHADSELHRRIHAESPYWDMMYKAMLDQLTDYIDLAVAQALDRYGIYPAPAAAPIPPARATRWSAARPVAEPVAIPSWLQPFVPSEKVRFTRTPDSLLRHEPRPLPPVEMPIEEAVRVPEQVAFDPDLPAWRRPFTLPPNVRINRGPQRRVVEDRAPAPGGDAPEMPKSSVPTSIDNAAPMTEEGVPGWFGIIRATPAPILPVDEQDNSAFPVEALEGSADLSTDDLLAEAWFASHFVPVVCTETETAEPAAIDEVAMAATVPPPVVEFDDRTDVFGSIDDGGDSFPIEETVLALLDHALDAGRPPPILLLPPSTPLPPPEAAIASTLELVEPLAAEAVSPEAASPEAAPPLRPTGIASPEDARAFAGPARSSGRRRGTTAGLAPFESVAAAATDPDLWEDPPVELLVEPPPPEVALDLSSGALEQNARLLEGVLEEFGVRGEIIDVRPGPVVTLYELEPAPGTKSSRVIGLSDDIARSMSAVSARVAVVQGRNVIGIELPNQRRETVFLRELIASQGFTDSKHKLAIALGKTIGGEEVIVDLARMPHLLVAGTTGSGKSVAINTMILSILYRLRPDQCRLIMIDPKMLELSIYEGIPHLLTPVVTDPKKAVVALKWAVREMEDRYKKMSKVGVRNIDGFNVRVAEAAEKGEVITRTVQTGFNRETGEPIFETEAMELSALPYIVVIVDEMADLMMVAGKDIEGAIQRLAQMARAAGIHLIMATQRPSVDVITGTIKANFPTRISFQVTSKIDSRTILGEQGAEQLLGQGDMLHMAGGGRISRVHGPFVSDGEVEKVVAHLKRQGHPAYLDVVVAEEDGADAKAEAAEDKPVFERSASGTSDDDNDLYEQAVKVVLRDKKCSTSYIQRRLQVGYNKAASLVERMEKEGLVGQANNAGKREILVYSRDLRFTESRDDE